ncbi:MAG: hypothetical protein ACK4R9_11450 [Ignavibacterium sp.]
MLLKLKQSISSHLVNLPGWRTNRKIIVIESDDWGSIRMPSREVYNRLLSRGINVDKCPYNRYDSLASEDDLNALFEVLTKFKDSNGHHPIITANTIVANPDFEKIKASNYCEYHYEPFTKTLKRYPSHSRSFALWQQGINNKLFWPQFHGREHLNVHRWLKFLRIGSNETLTAFDNELFGISTTITTEVRKSFLAAFEFDNFYELSWQKEMLADGLNLFFNIFEFKPKSFIAPNYIWHPGIEPVLLANGITFIQGNHKQLIPHPPSLKKVNHYLGQKNYLGQIYLVRNCIFEPSLDQNKDFISSCLKQIKNAFFLKKPAIISSHRVNFIGFIDENNRKRNLRMFEELFRHILNKWPEIEFMTSDQLGGLILQENETTS